MNSSLEIPVIKSNKSKMFELISYEKFRDTKDVRFFDISVCKSNYRDLVIHSGPAVSPPNDEEFNNYLISRGLISQDKVFSRLFFPIKFPVITEVKLDFEEDTNVKYLSSINPFPLGSKPLQPAPGIYNSAQACKSNSDGNGSSK